MRGCSKNLYIYLHKINLNLSKNTSKATAMSTLMVDLQLSEINTSLTGEQPTEIERHILESSEIDHISQSKHQINRSRFDLNIYIFKA